MSSSSLPAEQRIWLLNKAPTGELNADTFRLETRSLPALKDGEIMLKIDYLSNDPIQRLWISPSGGIVQEGMPMIATAIATVIGSKSGKYAVGNKLTGMMKWADYVIMSDPEQLSPAVDVPGTAAASISVLGATTLTAYEGVFEVLKPTAGQTVIISGASGAVGSVAVQFCKMLGATVIGIASQEKSAWVRELGADKVVDYKSPKFPETLKATAQETGGADRVLESVGGEVLNACIDAMKNHGILATIGSTSTYNGAKVPPTNILSVAAKSLTIKGYSAFEFIPRAGPAIEQITKWISDGKLKIKDAETVKPGSVDDIPLTWSLLFKGKSRAKLVTKVET